MRKLLGERWEKTNLLSEYGRQRLIGYAESFGAIAQSLYPKDNAGGQNMDRQNAVEWSEPSRQSVYYRTCLENNRHLLADNLQEMAGVMKQVAGEVFACRPFPVRRERRVVQMFKAEGITVRDLYYIEDREDKSRIGITMAAEKREGVSAEEAADMLSVLLNERLVPSINSPSVIDNCMRNFVFVEEAGFVVLTGAAKAVKENETRSGDNYAILESETGNVTMLLSDGMGSGEKACADSEEVLDLMERMIEAGYNPKSAAMLINTAFLTGEEAQNMSTLDICDLNLYNGVCEFTKIGAAASYLKRDYRVEKIEHNTLPLGTLKEPEQESIFRQLCDGDYIIMVSDGITDALEGDSMNNDLRTILGGLHQENPREMAEALLQIVLHKTGGHIRDDMTVLVFGIWENV